MAGARSAAAAAPASHNMNIHIFLCIINWWLGLAGTVSRLGSNIGKLPCPVWHGAWDPLQSGYNSVQLQFYASSQKANSSRRG